MYQLRLGLLATTLLSLAPAAAAHPPETAPCTATPTPSARVEYTAPPEWTAGDSIGAFLSAEAGLWVGGGLVAGTFELTRGADDWAPSAISLFAVAPLGSAAGVTLYGSLRGNNGSFWGALGGSYLGAAAGLGLAALAMDSDDHGEQMGLAWAALVTLPALGSTLGYYLTRDTDPQPAITSGALIDVGRDGVARLSVPNITVTPTADDTVVSVTLLGGAL